ncbi:hypothetical protein [Campylobacter corcagiensis]|uniref:Ferrochelatase n=1 Tax=Campylobacter corcagiensis TaxID=1448857 RepID=A0A7M1LEL7_9BACT|nr:hypothetical protein [Campylobacter corcagiensis]QKF64952.1 hypothetical protein CCORG_1103 [Campylobacter corcagiensis]QOQ86890.1 hypothetical protein IMC76_06650 [Campylobacter corcagiensis]
MDKFASLNIDNLVRLTKGELLSKPKISSVTNFATTTKEITLGSCYFTNDYSDALQALKLGAYAIICESKISLDDDEIALIKVDSIKRAKFRIMRYFVALKELKFVKVTPVMMEILENIKFDFSGVVLRSDFKQIINAPKKALVFSDEFDMDITKNFINLEPNLDIYPDILGSIFHTKILGQTLNLPEVFYPELHTLLNFLDTKEFKFRDFSSFSHFEPIFVDKFYRLKEFGTSYRAFIAESDEELFLRANKYLKAKFKQGILTFSPKTSSVKSDIKFKDLGQIKTDLDFRYALVLATKDEILEILSSKQDENLLF